MLKGGDGLNPHGWVYDYEIADLLGYPRWAVQKWMNENKAITQRRRYNTWRMEARLFREYRDVYELGIAEYSKNKRGRPRTRPPKREKPSKLQVRRAIEGRQGLPRRLATAFPELTDSEVIEIVDTYDFLNVVYCGDGVTEKGAEAMISIMRSYLRRLYHRGPRHVMKSNMLADCGWGERGHKVVTRDFKKDNVDFNE